MMRLRSSSKHEANQNENNHTNETPKLQDIDSSTTKHDKLKKLLAKEKKDRQNIVLWKKPLCTIHYFCQELFILSQFAVNNLRSRKKLVTSILCFTFLGALVYYLEGSHHQYIARVYKLVLWWSYWIGLGILSSVGLGTGLHTFLLYLGPHIASVTLAAYECESVNFPKPPYPDEIICPSDGSTMAISLWTIISKVRWESVMWGAGTAIGELPPYFMARAARLSGQEHEDDEFEEIEELLDERATHPSDLSVLEKLKLTVHGLVQRVGFFGILACASIPNPLFDLAGITCGHFLIPFWTFFGATLIGKSIIKMHIQKLFVVFVFSEHHVESVVKSLRFIPRFGPSLQLPFKNWLKAQKAKLHHKPGETTAQESSLLSWVFEKVIIVMVIYFILSIINSMAQSYHKRICKEKHDAST